MIDIEKFLHIVANEVSSYNVPVVDLIAVQTKDPFKVLVATILSARTKDEVTAAASERLFAVAADIKELAKLSEETLRKLIYPVGFYKNKARYLAALPEALGRLFDSKVPDQIDQLVQLPGVGRKTANLVVAVAFAKPAICVDTHVHRIMNIWGYVKTANPLQTEMALRRQLPGKYWIPVNSLLVSFGQGMCRPVGPHCDRCVLADLCPRLGVVPRKLKKKKLKQKGQQKIISWNVNGLRAVHKKGFVEIVNSMNPDIIGLQEIKAMEEQLPEEVINIGGYHSYFYSAERKGYSGVALYSKAKPDQVLYGIGDERFDREGRVLTLEFETFFVVNCYFPNSGAELARLPYKLDFNQCLQDFISKLSQLKSVVVCGDYNVAHKEIDLANPKNNEKNAGFTKEERQWMDDFVADGWIDTFRKFNQLPEQYSWWSYRYGARARNIGWRIDYFFVDHKSEKCVQDGQILAEVAGSDHCPVVLEFLPNT